MPIQVTYDPSLGTPRDRVRFLTGDKDPLAGKLDDAEIDYLVLVNNGDEVSAALEGVEGLLAYYAQLASNTMDATQWTASDIFKALMLLLDQLRARQARRASPYMGGLLETDKQTQELDIDRVRPVFLRDKTGPFSDSRLYG